LKSLKTRKQTALSSLVLLLESASTKAWVCVYVLLPMLPVILGAFIRLVISSWQLSYDTFSPSDLAICLALLVLLTNQSLLQHEELLDNPDKEADKATQAVGCLILAAFVLGLFALIVGCSIYPHLSVGL